MRAMVTLVSVLGVLIIAGVVVVAVTIVRRMDTPPATASLLLDEPPGTRMGSLSAAGDRLAVLLSGGGPDRVVLMDVRSGKLVGRVALAR